jgi:NAD(P)-dependent dehydrogenase (short-subunit alcohol dehydrogenase family)
VVTPTLSGLILRNNSFMKTIVLTGATSGIGKEVALQLLKSGHRVIANTRNTERSGIIKTELTGISGNDKLVFVKADFADFRSVIDFAGYIRANYSVIDILINNAGTWEMQFTETTDGIETNLQVNHLSPMLLTLELLPLLEKSKSGRIVNTSSGAHRRNIFDFKDIEWRFKTYDGIATYSQSKLFNILFSLQLTKILAGKDVTVNTIHPGYVKSALFNKMGARSWEGVADAKEGARSALYAALSPELTGVSGRYIYHELEDPDISELAKDEQLAKELWEISMNYISKYLS